MPRRDVALAAVLFFLSGAAALVYQVAWQRILALASGIGVYSICVIVAAFMLGLGLGSQLGGQLSRRLSARAALLGFALAELGVAGFGVLSPWLYYDGFVLRGAWLYSTPAGTLLAHLVALLLPTLLMGASLPLLVRALVRQTADAGRIVGVLYGINMLGAAAGALAAPWLLMPALGIGGAVRVAALGNAAAGLGALALSARRGAAVDAGAAPGVSEAAAPQAEHPRLGLWLALYAASGFVAIALEIVWFRIVDVAVRSSAFSFGTVLALYLAGAAAGCLLGIRSMAAVEQPLRAFLLCQCAVVAYAGLSAALLVWLPEATPGLRWFSGYWAGADRFRPGIGADAGALLRLYGMFPLLLFGPATLLMGYSFTLLQRAVHDDAADSGRKVGLLQAANIAGCVAGSLVVGLGLLSWIGSTGTLRVLLLCGVGFAAAGLRLHAGRASFAAFAMLLLALAAALPGQRQFWLRLHGVKDSRALVAEDATSVSALAPQSGRWLVRVNGKTHSWLPFGSVHTWLGAIPAVIHPAPQDVAVIGLGSGDTAWALGCRTETRSVSVFELAREQPRLLASLAAREQMPELQTLLSDPRVRLIAADGRMALRTGARYDVIEADATWPDVAYAGNMYSQEFFRECAARLRPGGIMCSWAPTPRVFATFVSVFPHALATQDHRLVLGSNEPLPRDVKTWSRRLAQPEVTAWLGESRAAEVQAWLEDLRVVRRRSETALNHDLFPRDEFAVP